jgi:hypothetical protein
VGLDQMKKHSDLGDYDRKNTDKDKIQKDATWLPCRICKVVYLRVRLTARYCNTCERAFCEGEHGSFGGGGPGVCIRCYKVPGDSELKRCPS